MGGATSTDYAELHADHRRVQGLLLRRTEFCQQIGKLRSVLKTSETWLSDST